MNGSLRVLFPCVLSYAAVAFGQAPVTAAKPVEVTGCVTAAPDVSGAYVFSNREMCAQVEGKFNAARAVGHMATFRGVLTPPTDGRPNVFTVQKQLSSGEVCSMTCHLAPPPTRGIHNSHVGKPASTDGAHDQPQQP